MTLAQLYSCKVELCGGFHISGNLLTILFLEYCHSNQPS